jgi:hypothetical protein
VSAGFFQQDLIPQNMSSGAVTPDLEFVSDAPQWFYCSSNVLPLRCGAGTVFAVNPGGDLDRFHAAADNNPVYSAPGFNNSLNAFTGSNWTSEMTNITRRGPLRRGPLRRDVRMG